MGQLARTPRQRIRSRNEHIAHDCQSLPHHVKQPAL